MKINILRHGIAVERGNPDYLDDSQRPLTKEGRKKLNDIAKTMQARKISFDQIITSPYLRALETTEIIIKKFKIKKDRISDSPNLVPDAPVLQIIHEINAHLPKAKNILLVGHEPHLSSLIAYLLTGNDTGVRINLKKGGLCQLEIKTLNGKSFANLDLLLNPY